MLYFIYKQIIFLIILHQIVDCQNNQSPCPDFFQYRYEQNQYFGAIELPPPPIGTTLKIYVNFSVRSSLPGSFYGSIKLNGTREETLSDIIKGNNVRYKVTFPVPWPLPKLTSIIFNNQIICTGPPYVGRMVTAIKLEHILYTEAAALALRSLRIDQPKDYHPNWSFTKDRMMENQDNSKIDQIG